jgi:hypothetical protein
MPVATLHEWLGAHSPLPVHEVVQAPAEQAQGEQEVTVPAMQAPLPLHVDVAARFWLPLHVAAPQTMPAAAGAQAPIEPWMLHALQTGQLATPQQTPSTQWPLRHCGSFEQAVPFVFRLVHAPPTQLDPRMQSPSPAQVVRHAPVPAPQRNGLQLVECCAHVPVPLQKPTGINVELVHDDCPHDVVVGAFAQLPAPSHAPVNPQGGAATQRACGSAAASGTALQAPARPVTLQAWQVPQEGAEQHTPSTQKLPVRHSSLVPHAWPRRFLPPQRFVPRSQMFGAAQLASETQVVSHVEPLQAKGAQEIVVAAWQLPMPSHVRASVSTVAPTGHDIGAQVVPAA